MRISSLNEISPEGLRGERARSVPKRWTGQIVRTLKTQGLRANWPRGVLSNRLAGEISTRMGEFLPPPGEGNSRSGANGEGEAGASTRRAGRRNTAPAGGVSFRQTPPGRLKSLKALFLAAERFARKERAALYIHHRQARICFRGCRFVLLGHNVGVHSERRAPDGLPSQPRPPMPQRISPDGAERQHGNDGHCNASIHGPPSSRHPPANSMQIVKQPRAAGSDRPHLGR